MSLASSGGYPGIAALPEAKEGSSTIAMIYCLYVPEKMG
jgi:hypothetical protein